MSHAFDKPIVQAPPALSGPERLASVLAHGAFLVVGVPLVAPIFVLVVFSGLGRATPYVRAQALQAMLLQAVIFIVAGLAIAFFMIGNHAIWSMSPTDWAEAVASAPGPTLVLLVGLLVALAGSFLEFVAAAQALRGQIYNLPVIGKLVRS